MMKRTIILLLSVLTISHAMGKTWDLRVSDNQRFLQYADGTPFFWLGDTGWLLPQRLNEDEATAYLSRASEAGFNVVQVQVLNDVPSVNAYGQYSNDPQKPWDFSCFNYSSKGKENASAASPSPTNGLTASYWDHMDYIIRQAERHNIYIGMVCIWGGLVKKGALDMQGAKAYGKFLAERYKDFPNIIWIMGGDIQGDIRPEVWNALAQSIKSIDRRHLMTFHPRGRYTSAKWWAGAEWMDASTGDLTYMGQHDSTITTFSPPHHPAQGIHDGILIAIDARCKYLTDRKNIIR